MPDWTSEEIGKQLNRILASRELVASPKLSQLLEYLTSHSLQSGSERINQYDIAVNGLGYGPEFDPATNPSVRIMVGRLRRALRRYYDNSGEADPFRFHIPKGIYVIHFSANKDRSAPFPEGSGTAWPAPVGQPSNPSIAVIGFENLSASADNDHIASGLTEEITIAMGRFSRFRVKGPLNRSILGQDGSEPALIGRRFGARFVLDGSVRCNSVSFRLSVRLIDAASGNQIWGDVMDSGLQQEAMLGFDNRIVSRVVATIAENHGVIPSLLLKETRRQEKKKLTSYEAILYFYQYNKEFTEESYINALTGLEKAVSEDASDATASGMLADLTALQWQFGMTDDPSILDRAGELARHAVNIDTSNQPARFALALVLFLKSERALFLEEAERALEINPDNANYVASLALHITLVGEQVRGMELMRRAMELNPHHASWYHFVPYLVAYLEGDYEQALGLAHKFNTPKLFWDPMIRAIALGCLDRQRAARRAVDELLALEPDFRKRGRDLIHRLMFQEKTTEALVSGLSRAGLELAPARAQD